MPEITVTQEPQGIEGGLVPNDNVPDRMLATYFNVIPEQARKEEVKMINDLKRYLETQSDDDFEQLQALRDLRHRVGQTPIGKSEIEHLYEYVRLRQASEELDMRVREMER